MAVAVIYPEPERGRGKKDPAKGIETISFQRINHARTVLKFAPWSCGGDLFPAFRIPRFPRRIGSKSARFTVAAILAVTVVKLPLLIARRPAAFFRMFLVIGPLAVHNLLGGNVRKPKNWDSL